MFPYTPLTLAHGVYRVTRDLPALRLDKCVKYDWRALPISTGTLFAVEWESSPFNDARTMLTISRLEGGAHCYVTARQTELLPLIASFERVHALTATQHLQLHHRINYACQLLDALVAKGRLTLEEIDTLCEAEDISQ